MKRATTNNLFEAKQVHITLCVCCKFSLFSFPSKKFRYFLFYQYLGEISGILLQVFVATCNKGRGHIVEGKVGDTLGGFTILNVGFFKWGIDSIY